jgi:hypothetical protein
MNADGRRYFNRSRVKAFHCRQGYSGRVGSRDGKIAEGGNIQFLFQKLILRLLAASPNADYADGHGLKVLA